MSAFQHRGRVNPLSGTSTGLSHEQGENISGLGRNQREDEVHSIFHGNQDVDTIGRVRSSRDVNAEEEEDRHVLFTPTSKAIRDRDRGRRKQDEVRGSEAGTGNRNAGMTETRSLGDGGNGTSSSSATFRMEESEIGAAATATRMSAALSQAQSDLLHQDGLNSPDRQLPNISHPSSQESLDQHGDDWSIILPGTGTGTTDSQNLVKSTTPSKFSSGAVSSESFQTHNIMPSHDGRGFFGSDGGGGVAMGASSMLPSGAPSVYASAMDFTGQGDDEDGVEEEQEEDYDEEDEDPSSNLGSLRARSSIGSFSFSGLSGTGGSAADDSEDLEMSTESLGIGNSNHRLYRQSSRPRPRRRSSALASNVIPEEEPASFRHSTGRQRRRSSQQQPATSRLAGSSSQRVNLPRLTLEGQTIDDGSSSSSFSIRSLDEPSPDSAISPSAQSWALTESALASLRSSGSSLSSSSIGPPPLISPSQEDVSTSPLRRESSSKNNHKEDNAALTSSSDDEHRIMRTDEHGRLWAEEHGLSAKGAGTKRRHRKSGSRGDVSQKRRSNTTGSSSTRRRKEFASNDIKSNGKGKARKENNSSKERSGDKALLTKVAQFLDVQETLEMMGQVQDPHFSPGNQTPIAGSTYLPSAPVRRSSNSNSRTDTLRSKTLSRTSSSPSRSRQQSHSRGRDSFQAFGEQARWELGDSSNEGWRSWAKDNEMGEDIDVDSGEETEVEPERKEIRRISRTSSSRNQTRTEVNETTNSTTLLLHHRPLIEKLGHHQLSPSSISLPETNTSSNQTQLHRSRSFTSTIVSLSLSPLSPLSRISSSLLSTLSPSFREHDFGALSSTNPSSSWPTTIEGLPLPVTQSGQNRSSGRAKALRRARSFASSASENERVKAQAQKRGQGPTGTEVRREGNGEGEGLQGAISYWKRVF